MTDQRSPAGVANPALSHWDGALGLPDFGAFGDGDFEAAFDEALAGHNRQIEAIATDPDAPSIDNTLKALELSGQALDHVASIFWLRAGAYTNDTIQTLERAMAPKMARHFTTISMDPRLFARIDALYARRGEFGLDPEADRVLEKVWKGFVRNGAKLDENGRSPASARALARTC